MTAQLAQNWGNRFAMLNVVEYSGCVRADAARCTLFLFVFQVILGLGRIG